MEVDLPMDIQPGELRCPTCFRRDIVLSLRRGLLDDLMFRLGREPRHCRSCGRRFYIRPERFLIGPQNEERAES